MTQKKKKWMWLIPAAVLFLVWKSLGYPGMNVGYNREMPEALHPKVKESSEELVSRATDIGILIDITEGLRTNEEQEQLYAKGRSEEGNIVTYAGPGESYHNYGLAIDFALKGKDGRLIWDMEHDMNGNSKSDWKEVVDIAKDLGFEWGGDWERFKDYPHLQMTFGLSITELKWGRRPNGTPGTN